MLNRLTIVARIEAKIENLDLVKSEILKLIEPTRKEKGCVQYDLCQDNEKPEVFIFIENWESQELWESHLESSHFKYFVDITDGLLVDLTVNQMTQI